MYGNNYRNSSLAAEEIQVLKAISRVSARLAQKLAALDNQRQTKEGGNRNVKTGGIWLWPYRKEKSPDDGKAISLPSLPAEPNAQFQICPCWTSCATWLPA